MFTSPGSIAFTAGPLTVRWYGLIIAAGIILCYLYATREAVRRGVSRKPIDDMAFWVIAAGVIGARLYYVLFNLSYFTDNPSEIPQLWHGGLAIHGALLGGAAAYFIYVFMKKLSWRLYADIIIPGILLAQALGRFGNFFNNEAFGRPTDLPWKLFIPPESRPREYADFSYFHPTFLYESLWNFLGCILLIFISRRLFPARKNLHGMMFFSYMIWYSLGRFFIEGLRTDSLYFGPLRAAQVMSLLLFTGGIFGLLFIFRRRKI